MTFIAATALAVAAGPAADAHAASSCRSDLPTSTLQYFADFTAGPDSRAFVRVSPHRGDLTSLSFRAIRDIAVKVKPRRTLGTVRFGGKTYTLRTPRMTRNDGRYQVFRKAFADGAVTTVTVRTSASKYRVVGCTVPLSVTGLPTGTKSVSLNLAPGVLGPAHSCPARPTLGLYAQRRGAAPLHLRSGISC